MRTNTEICLALGVRNLCSVDDLFLDPQPVRVPPYTVLVCPICDRGFKPPKFSDGGFLVCPWCGHFDKV